MSETKIQWTERTWNPIAGCSVVSPGCTNCYAMRRVAPRLAANPATPHYHGTVQPSKAGHIWTGKIGVASEAKFLEPLRIRKPSMWFVNSTSDLFHENVPDEVIDRVFAVMALTAFQPLSRQSRSTPLGWHTFQVLTKRSARMREYMSSPIVDGRIIVAAISMLPTDWRESETLRWGSLRLDDKADTWNLDWPLPNVWLGVSVENQTRADERIPDLLATPAAIRFISAEPLLGLIDLRSIDPTGMQRKVGASGWSAIWKDNALGRACLDWVIVGGESGSGARPMHPDWARSIRDQCATAGVPFFFKQWGDHLTGYIDDGGEGLWFNAASREADSRFLIEADQFDWFDAAKAPDGPAWLKLGTKRAGRRLDGIEHNAMPEARP